MTRLMMRFGVFLAACTLASACSVLGPIPDHSRYFTLTAIPEAKDRADGARERREAGREILIGLGPIVLPAYLDRREVATRVSPTELTYSATDYWAQPLVSHVTSVVLQNLSTLLGTDRIVPYPWVGAVTVDYQIEVTLLGFERDGAGDGHLTGRWAIRDGRSGRELIANVTTFTRPAPPKDTSATATALSATLGDLSAEIADALPALPPPEAARPPASVKRHPKPAVLNR